MSPPASANQTACNGQPASIGADLDPSDLARWTNGNWEGVPPPAIRKIGHDTRQDLSDALYVALRGMRFDGHAFLAEARRKGAVAAIVDADCQTKAGPLPLLRVADSAIALQAAAAARRRAVDNTLVGITGSMGKTTVKDLLGAMLAPTRHVWATRGNWNNAIGLPLCLLGMPANTECAVIEIGTSAPGEIRALSAIAQPDAAIMTRIGPAHIAAFGSLEAIAFEKADLLRCLPANGFAVLDRDDPFFALFAAAANCEHLTVSVDHQADYQAEILNLLHGHFRVTGKAVDQAVVLHSGLAGRHHVTNALLALAAARRLGCPWKAIQEGFRAARISPMRWQVSRSGGITIVNDAYNANPCSMAAALETFATFPDVERKLLILGDMLELGSHSNHAHQELGRDLARTVWDAIWLVGKHADLIREGALQAGVRADRIHCVPNAAAVAPALLDCLRPGDAVLLKASRGIGLEAVAQALTAADRPLAGKPETPGWEDRHAG